MLQSLVTVAALGAMALAAPQALPPQSHIELSKRDTAYNASLPNITIFATGGTIAGSAGSQSQTTGYKAGALGVDVLIDAVPELANVSNVRGVQVTSVDSNAITDGVLLNMTRLVAEALEDPTVQGVVVTHGTDTLEESAFFLDLTLNSSKPVVIAGSMRPATAISADGPINLLEAVTLAASDSAKDRGVMVVLNDRIVSAWFASKTNANAMDTFKAYEEGFLGVFVNVKPVFYYAPALPVGKTYFDVAETKSLPQVDVLYGYQDLDASLATAAVENGAEGLILAGVGAGGWTDEGLDVVEGLIADNGTQVVVSRRTMDGYVEPKNVDGMYGGGFLSPQKARILLQLAINAGYTNEQMKSVFEYDS